MFPSPHGEFIFQIKILTAWWTSLEFPSPHGEFIFQIMRKESIMIKIKPVSVPSRGIYIPNWNNEERRIIRLIVSVPSRGIYIPNIVYFPLIVPYWVSVPSRGIYIPNLTQKQFHLLRTEFPSPHGEFIFQILLSDLLSLTAPGFRPLTGNLYSKLRFNSAHGFSSNCFRPLTGNLYSK